MLKRLLSVFLTLLLLVSFSACSVAVENDILTQKVIENGRIPITVLVKYAFTINTFEKEVEKLFPNIDLIQVGNYTRDMGIAEYESRMKNDDLTDITMTWPLEVGKQYWKERLIDLSGLPFANKYKQPMLENVKDDDGKIYYLPGPSQVRGIVYNKTLFEENGWSVPADFEGFVKLCKAIETEKKSDGTPKIRSLQLGLENSEVLDTAFVGYGYNQGFSSPTNADWIDNYNNGNGNFNDNFSGALSVFQRLVDEKILTTNDLNVDYADREYDLFNRRCAMVEDSSNIINLSKAISDVTDEYSIMPFFSPHDGNNIDSHSDLARIYPICFIGANKHLEERKNATKLELVMKLLEYISTPSGQAALTGDAKGMFSSLSNVPLEENVPELTDMKSAIDGGRYAIFTTLKNLNAQNALRSGLRDIIKGEKTALQVADYIDKQNKKEPIVMTPTNIGSAKESFTLLETGNFITDTMRKNTGCEIALFLDNGKDGKYNGKGVSGKFYKGDISFADIKRILPDLKQKEKGELWKITMTGEDLIDTLEYSLSVFKNVDGWFYYFSGLKMEFSPTAKPGNRIKKITDARGNAIDLKKEYSIAVMDYTVEAGYIKSCKKTGILISSILENEIIDMQVIAPSKDNRFIICN